jgi:hypothetical protein
MSCHQVAAHGGPPKLAATTNHRPLSSHHHPVTAWGQHPKLTASIGCPSHLRVGGRSNAAPAQVNRNRSNIENMKVPNTLLLHSVWAVGCGSWLCFPWFLHLSAHQIYPWFLNQNVRSIIFFTCGSPNYCCIGVIGPLYFYQLCRSLSPWNYMYILLASQDALCIHAWFWVGKHLHVP